MELLNEGDGIDLSLDLRRPKDMLEGRGRPCRFAEKEVIGLMVPSGVEASWRESKIVLKVTGACYGPLVLNESWTD